MATDQIKENVLVKLKYATEGVGKLQGSLDTVRKKIVDINRNITAASLKMQKTTSAAWTTRFKDQIHGLKTQKLALQRNGDVVARNLSKEEGVVDSLRKKKEDLVQLGQRQAREQKRISKLQSGGSQKLLNEVGVAQKLADAHDSWGGVMGMSMETFKKVNQGGARFNTVMGRTANKIRMATHGLRGFRMELLGVMFFGMGMANMFQGLLRPAMEIAGIFKIWGVTLQVLFLPVVLQLMPVFIQITTTLQQMSDSMKRNVGWFVIFGFVIGKIIFLIGMLGLGIGSLIQVGAFKMLLGFFGKLGKLGSGGGLLGFFAIVIVLIAGIWFAFKENFGNIKGLFNVWVSGFKDQFDGLVKFFSGIWDLIVGIITGDSDLVVSGIKDIFIGLFKFIWGSLKMVFAGVGIIILGILKIIQGFFDIITEGVVGLINLIPGIDINSTVYALSPANVALGGGILTSGSSGGDTNIGTINQNVTVDNTGQLTQDSLINQSIVRG